MAEPAKKLEINESAPNLKKGKIVKFEISEKPSNDTGAKAGEIVNFPPRQDRENRRNFDSQIREARREKKEAADQKLDTDQIPDERTNLAKARSITPAPRQLSEESTAETAKQGAPMVGGTGGGTFSGDTGSMNNLDSDDKTGESLPRSGPTSPQKKEAEKSQPEPNQPNKNENTEGQPAGTGQPEEENQPKTRQQQLEKNLQEQRAGLAARAQDVEKAKEKKDSLGEEKEFRRSLADRRIGTRKKRLEKQKKAAAKAEAALAKHIKIKEALRQSWLNLIDSFGATYLYIVFHFLNAYFTPWSNLFCKFGEEWLPSTPAIPTPQAATKKASKMLEIIEIGGCVLIGLILFAAITLTATIFISAIYVIANPVSTLASLSWDTLHNMIFPPAK